MEIQTESVTLSPLLATALHTKRGERTIRRWCDEGRVRFVRDGGQILVVLEDAERVARELARRFPNRCGRESV